MHNNCRGGPPWPPDRRNNMLESDRLATEGHPYSCFVKSGARFAKSGNSGEVRCEWSEQQYRCYGDRDRGD